jgi:hypothetical protein
VAPDKPVWPKNDRQGNRHRHRLTSRKVSLKNAEGQTTI